MNTFIINWRLDNMTTLKAPFPYFGGKVRTSGEVWKRFGYLAHYIEPFAGSLAVLLSAPEPSYCETVNDKDGLLCNFWRAIQHDPLGVAQYAQWPLCELDLHARHYWLVSQKQDITFRLMGDPEWYDSKAAGWWVWGICNWIGQGWCSGTGSWVSREGIFVKKVDSSLPGVSKQLPLLGRASSGVRVSNINLFMQELSERIRNVKVVCGDWKRVLGTSLTTKFVKYQKRGHVGIFLDPPYAEGTIQYAVGDSQNITQEVLEFCKEWGCNSIMRIAVCGYDEYKELEERGWEPYYWKANGGYGQGQGCVNSTRETIWFSPHCLREDEDSILSLLEN